MKKSIEKTNMSRVEYLDYLRAMATIAVVFYHVGKTGTPLCLITLFLNWCVPIFVMITGTLFLDKNKQVSEEKMLIKYIPKFLMILLIWGFIYNFISTAIIEKSIDIQVFLKSVIMVVKADTTYCFQFWYLYLVVGLYLIIPLIRPLSDKLMCMEKPSRECKIIFLMLLILTVLAPNIVSILNYEEEIWKGAFEIFFGGGFVYYMLCAQWISHWGIQRRLKMFLFTLFLGQSAVFLYEIFIGNFGKIENWYGYTSFFTWNMSVLLFDTIRGANFTKLPGFVKKIVFTVSKYSLGIYILHVIILQFMRKIFGFDVGTMNEWVFPVVAVAITTVICTLISAVMKKIKWVKNLI